MVVDNALFNGNRKCSDLVVPWATFTEPEVAHVGVYGHEVRALTKYVYMFALRSLKSLTPSPLAPRAGGGWHAGHVYVEPQGQ